MKALQNFYENGFEQSRFCLDSKYLVIKIKPEESRVFKSNNYPLSIKFLMKIVEENNTLTSNQIKYIKSIINKFKNILFIK